MNNLAQIILLKTSSTASISASVELREFVFCLLDVLSKDHKKLSGKYSYLITKLNKQDSTVKMQSKMLNQISSTTCILKDEFIQYSEEINFYLKLLTESFNKKPGQI